MATSGTLKLEVIEAQLTRDTETFGKMDPYVKIQTRMQAFRTKTKNGAGKTPKWQGEVFSLDVKYIGDDITMQAFDEDPGKDDLIGESVVKISALTMNNGIDEWFDIQFKGKKSGMLRLKSTWQPHGGAPKPGQAQGAGQPMAAAAYPPQQPGYPPQGYPQQPGYPPQQPGYPPQQPGYPPQGYPQQPGYPPQQPGYPPQQPGYPPQQHGYPPQQPGYPPQQPGYPPQGYPQQPGYPMQQPMGQYPPQPMGAYPPQHGYPQQPNPYYQQPHATTVVVSSHGHGKHGKHGKHHKKHKKMKFGKMKLKKWF